MTLNQIFGFDFEKKRRTKLTNFSKNQNFVDIYRCQCYNLIIATSIVEQKITE